MSIETASHREPVKTLCKTIISRLENNKAIMFAPRLRQIVSDEVYSLVGPLILTDGDLREKALARMGAKAEALQGSEISESDQFKAAKAAVKESLGQEPLNGFYFQKPVRSVADEICRYLMRSSHIDDVFESDEDLEKTIVEIIRRFEAKNAH